MTRNKLQLLYFMNLWRLSKIFSKSSLPKSFYIKYIYFKDTQGRIYMSSKAFSYASTRNGTSRYPQKRCTAYSFENQFSHFLTMRITVLKFIFKQINFLKHTEYVVSCVTYPKYLISRILIVLHIVVRGVLRTLKNQIVGTQLF